MRLRLRLHEPTGHLLPYVKLQVIASAGSPEVSVSALIEWPTARGDTETFESIFSEPVAIRVATDGRHTLEYVPESTVLLKPQEESLFARLPDGVMDTGGIILKNVGSPPGCWNCDLDQIRFVEFETRVVG